MTFTALEKFGEARREVAMRRRVYPHFVERGKLKQEDADRQIAVMEAIAEDYRPAAEEEKRAAEAAAEANKKQMNLF